MNIAIVGTGYVGLVSGTCSKNYDFKYLVLENETIINHNLISLDF